MKKAGNFPALDGSGPIVQPEISLHSEYPIGAMLSIYRRYKIAWCLSITHKSNIPHHIHEILESVGTLHGPLVKHHEVPKLSPGSSFPCLAQFQLAPGIGVVPHPLGLDGKEDAALVMARKSG
mgnify:CR=1 FL=1